MGEIGTIDRLNPASFGKIIDDIEYQKAFLFRMVLPTIETKNMGTLTPDTDKFELCTASTALPSISTDVQPIAFYNSELKILTKTKYGNWNATFRLDTNRQTVTYDSGKMTTWEYFYIWQLMANWPYALNVTGEGTKYVNSFTSALPKEYKKTIDLFLLRDDADPTNAGPHYQLQGVTPVSISGGNLDYSADSLLTYNVEFAFDRFIVMDIYFK